MIFQLGRWREQRIDFASSNNLTSSYMYVHTSFFPAEDESLEILFLAQRRTFFSPFVRQNESRVVDDFGFS